MILELYVILFRPAKLKVVRLLFYSFYHIHIFSLIFCPFFIFINHFRALLVLADFRFGLIFGFLLAFLPNGSISLRQLFVIFSEIAVPSFYDGILGARIVDLFADESPLGSVLSDSCQQTFIFFLRPFGVLLHQKKIL